MNLSQWILGAVVTGAVVAGAGAALSQESVKIGVLTDMTAVTTDLAGRGSVEAARMAVLDHGGQVLGRPVEVVSADFQFKPELAASIATEWYDRGGVDLIVDIPNSAAALAVQEIAKARNKLVMFSSAGTPALSREACSPNGIQWTYDTYVYSKSLVVGLSSLDIKKWYFITGDYAGGISGEESMRSLLPEAGGEVVGGVRVPISTTDFSSYVLQAKSSGADAVVITFGGAPTVRVMEAAREYGLEAKLVSPAMFLTDVKSIGLPSAQDAYLTDTFYWDFDEETRAWSERYFSVMQKMPTAIHAGVYTEIRHYLKAVEAAGTTDGDKVAEKIRELPIDDFMAKGLHVQPNGTVMRDRYVFRVKKPEESQGEWDLYDLVTTVPGDVASIPPKDSGCPLVK